MQLIEDNVDERVIKINESMFADMKGFLPPNADNCKDTYVINYMKKGIIDGIATTKTLDLSSIFVQDIDGTIKECDKSFLYDAKYSIYRITENKKQTSLNFKTIVENIGEIKEPNYIYETLFDKHMYTKGDLKWQ